MKLALRATIQALHWQQSIHSPVSWLHLIRSFRRCAWLRHPPAVRSELQTHPPCRSVNVSIHSAFFVPAKHPQYTYGFAKVVKNLQTVALFRLFLHAASQELLANVADRNPPKLSWKYFAVDPGITEMHGIGGKAQAIVTLFGQTECAAQRHDAAHQMVPRKKSPPSIDDRLFFGSSDGF